MEAKALQSQIEDLKDEIQVLVDEPESSPIQASNNLFTLDRLRKELQELEEQLDELL